MPGTAPPVVRSSDLPCGAIVAAGIPLPWWSDHREIAAVGRMLEDARVEFAWRDLVATPWKWSAEWRHMAGFEHDARSCLACADGAPKGGS